MEQDGDDGHGREGKLRIARLTALLQEFELHLRKKELERARDRLATITTTLALALTDAQKRLANTRRRIIASPVLTKKVRITADLVSTRNNHPSSCPSLRGWWTGFGSGASGLLSRPGTSPDDRLGSSVAPSAALRPLVACPTRTPVRFA